MLQNFHSLKFKNEFFVFLLPLFFILNGLNEHFDAIALKDALLLLLKYFLAIIIIGLLFFLFFRSATKALLITFLIMLFYLFFGSIHDWLKDNFDNLFLSKYTFILPFALVGLGLIVLHLKKSKSTYKQLTRFLNFLFLILIMYETVKFFIIKTERRTEIPASLTICTTCPKPDIYLIISDTYGGKQELKEVFDFDNAPFEDSLKKRNFHVVQNSISNYRSTIYSIASLLNLSYLDKVTGKEEYKDYNYLFSKINNSVVVKYLKETGYNIENFSLFNLDNEASALNNSIFQTGTHLITNHNFFGRLEKDLGYHFVTNLKIDKMIERFNKRKEAEDTREKYRDRVIINKALSKISKKEKYPRFFYIHLYQPHGPSFFGKNGKPLSDTLTEYEKYIESLQYTNKLVLKLIDHIKQTSSDSSVILFMGDHGFRFGNSQYSFMTMNSIYLPRKNYSDFYNGFSHVNQFRVVFNNLFNQNISLLKDSNVRF